MPTYEYACRACGEHLEVVQSFRDDPLTDCPACQGQLRKVFSAAGIIFKGSGWHVKDYASSSRATNGSSGSGDADGRSTSGEHSGENSGERSKAGDSADRPASTSKAKTATSDASTSSSERAASA